MNLDLNHMRAVRERAAAREKNEQIIKAMLAKGRPEHSSLENPGVLQRMLVEQMTAAEHALRRELTPRDMVEMLAACLDHMAWVREVAQYDAIEEQWKKRG